MEKNGGKIEDDKLKRTSLNENIGTLNKSQFNIILQEFIYDKVKFKMNSDDGLVSIWHQAII